VTDYSRLLNEGRLKRGRFSRRQWEDCLSIARRDIETSRAILTMSPEWAFNIAYNAMHQAGRAILFHQGFRAVGDGHHATVIRFLEIALGSDYGEMLAVMDRMRRKRNRATYDMAGTIGADEALEAISATEEFAAIASGFLKRQRRCPVPP
jgi:uncharacterized protein (UPF0332 family)